jgi:hypothetical protein
MLNGSIKVLVALVLVQWLLINMGQMVFSYYDVMEIITTMNEFNDY